jgi:hypothetical protein
MVGGATHGDRRKRGGKSRGSQISGRSNPARRNGIHADRPWGELSRKGLRGAYYSRLRGGIYELVIRRDESVDGGEVHDGRAIREVRQEGLHDQKRPEDIGVEDVTIELRREDAQVTCWVDASGVDDGVDVMVLGQRAIRNRSELLCFTHICLDTDVTLAGQPHRLEIDPDHNPSVAVQARCRCLTHATGGPCHHGRQAAR